MQRGETVGDVVEELPASNPRKWDGLSTRVFLLILIFLTPSGLIIQIPLIAGHLCSYLEHRVVDAYIATLVLRTNPESRVTPVIERKLLEQARVINVDLPETATKPRLVVGPVRPASAVLDLREHNSYYLLWRSLVMLLMMAEPIVQVLDDMPGKPGQTMSILLDERQIYLELRDYSLQAIGLSLVISLITAILVYLGLQRLMVRSIKRVTGNLVVFRQAPEEPKSILIPSRRDDEIGLLEQELARMQTALRAALAQQSRLAALGSAVSRIHHDLKSILSTVSLASERLNGTADPVVGKIAALLTRSVEKAIYLCTQTLDLARGEQPVLQRSRFPLRALVEEVGEALKLGHARGVAWQNDVTEKLVIEADRERLYRVLFNLGQNAVHALKDGGRVCVAAHPNTRGVAITLSDNGPGIPPEIRSRLFQPFTGSARSGGMGLGLATARDLIRAHDGDLTLMETGETGTVFRIDLEQAL